ncbi:LysE family transporter [Microvirga tunisiensis]|uniref:LysE family transporter n=1 Tax=Pannonibacter tanglangensis TaxID=2750084 RepID=A0A7X5F3F3_9HYPH|nr:LysE family translocator [Pannonibacter sp. XCT-53]NBN78769.1 LysE family transporter [Pannonibacter sp. XCT-53]
MDIASALLGFSIAAALLTMTPGLDTALVLRTATVEGARPALMAGLGIVAGCLAWGLAAALGLGAVLAVSQTAFQVLQICGALYLIWLGIGMIRAALRRPGQTGPAGADADGTMGAGAANRATAPLRWFWRGLVTNLLNPKVGVFYVSFLPQFLPQGVDVAAFSTLLAAMHAGMGLVWFALLIAATRPLARLLARPAVTRSLDGLTGAVLVAFGVRLLAGARS